MEANREAINKSRDNAGFQNQRGAEQSGLAGNGVAELASTLGSIGSAQLGVLSNIASSSATTAANTTQMVSLLSQILARGGMGGGGGGGGGRSRAASMSRGDVIDMPMGGALVPVPRAQAFTRHNAVWNGAVHVPTGGFNQRLLAGPTPASPYVNHPGYTASPQLLLPNYRRAAAAERLAGAGAGGAGGYYQMGGATLPRLGGPAPMLMLAGPAGSTIQLPGSGASASSAAAARWAAASARASAAAAGSGPWVGPIPMGNAAGLTAGAPLYTAPGGAAPPPPPPPPQRGGGGGRGGGGWWNNRGNWGQLGRGASHVASYAGMGAFSGLVQMATSGPVGLGIAAAAGLLTGPQMLAGVGEEMLGLSAPWRGYMKDAYAYGRAGNTFGGSVAAQFFRDKMPEWMSNTGTTSQGALDLLNTYGIIAPGGAIGAAETAKDIATAGMLPGLSGMDKNAYIGFARRMNSMGLSGKQGTVGAIAAASPIDFGTSTNAGNTLQSLSAALSSAVTLGLDRAQVLRSIEAGVQMQAARGSMAMDYDATQNFMLRMMSGGSPASKSGALGMEAVSGVAGAIDNAPNSPVENTMMYSLMASANTPEGLQKLLGKDKYAKMMKDKASAAEIKDYLAQAKTNPGAAYAKFQDILHSLSPDEFRTAAENYETSIGVKPDTPMGRTITARLMNVRPQVLYNQTYDTNGPSSPLPGGYGGYDDQAEGEYRKALARVVSDPKEIDALMKYGKKYNINPAYAAAYMMEESSGNANSVGAPVASRGGDRARGLFQLMSKEWNNMGGGNPFDIDTNVEHGMHLLFNKRANNGNSIGAGMARMVGNPNMDETKHAVYRMGQILAAENLPTDITKKEVDVNHGTMKAAETSFAEFGTAADKFSGAVTTFGNTIQWLIAQLGAPSAVKNVQVPGGHMSVPALLDFGNVNR